MRCAGRPWVFARPLARGVLDPRLSSIAPDGAKTGRLNRALILAGTAAHLWIARTKRRKSPLHPATPISFIAMMAYNFADAMLAARSATLHPSRERGRERPRLKAMSLDRSRVGVQCRSNYCVSGGMDGGAGGGGSGVTGVGAGGSALLGGSFRTGGGGSGTGGGGVVTGGAGGAPFGGGRGLPSLVSSLMTGTLTFTGPTARSSSVRRVRVSSTL
jgi:hypothetical protein